MSPTLTKSQYEQIALTEGMLPTSMVARLVGVGVGQLRSWSRSGLIAPASKRNGRSGAWSYSWIDYCQARVAKRLLDRGLARARLQDRLDRLDELIEGWYTLLLDDHRSHRLVRNGDGYAIAEPDPRSVAEDRASYEAVGQVDVASDACLVEVVLELQREGSLGTLCRYRDHVTINPSVQFGAPTLVGTRIQTWVIAPMVPQTPIESIIRGYPRLSSEQIHAAAAFERSLEA